MHIIPSVAVRDLAIAIPGATKLFASRGIDYYCRGARPLAEACADAGVRVDEFIAELERAAAYASEPSNAERWTSAPLSALAQHIVSRHHTYAREQLDRVGDVVREVRAVQNARRGELGTLSALLSKMDEDLRPHLMTEEAILFPYIVELEAARRAGRARPSTPFGTVHNPVRMMMHGHDHFGELLRALRAQTNGYEAPAYACPAWRALYAGLQALEQDLFEHLHLEANVLFPRAIEMELG